MAIQLESNHPANALGTELRRSEARFKATFEQAAVGIAHVSPQGGFLRINQKFCDIVGYTHEEMLAIDFQSITHPKDLQSDLGFVKQMLDDEIENYSLVKRYIHKNDYIVWVNLTVSLLRTKDGSADYFISVVEDITKQKKIETDLRESEERFRALFKSSNDCVFLQEGTLFVDCNPATLKLFGATSYEQILGHSVEEFSLEDPNDPRAVLERVEDKLQTAFANGSNRFEWLACKLNGTKLILDIVLSPLLIKDKKMIQAVCRDITKQKQIEQTLYENEKRIQAIFDNTSDGLLLVDIDTKRFTDTNKTFCQLLGYDYDEVLKLGMMDIHPKSDLAYVTSQFEKQVKGEITIAVDIPMLRKDGSVFYCDVRSNAFSLGGKQLIVGMFHDLSERKKAQQTIINNEKYVKDLLDVTTDWVWEVDSNGHYVFVGQEAEELLGYPVKDIIGKSPFDFMPEKESKRIKEIFSACVANKESLRNLKNINLHQDGHEVIFLTNAVPIYDQSGVYIGYRGADTDITERIKQQKALSKLNKELEKLVDERTRKLELSEKHYRLLSENITDVVWILDLESMSYDYISPSVKQLRGYTSEEASQLSLKDTLTTESLDYGSTYLANMIDKYKSGDIEKASGIIQLEQQCKDGSTVWTEVSSIIVQDETGDLKLTGVTRDISERKANDEILQQAKLKAEEANQAKSSFLANMSHELRTPMHGVISFADMGLKRVEKSDVEKNRQYYSYIKMSAARLMLLLNDLLDLSKLESGKMIMVFTENNLYEVTQNCILEQQARLEEYQQEINFISDKQEALGQFDNERISQVITNLLSNAIKFSPKKSILEFSIADTEIEVSEKMLPALLFSIRDHGAGILNDEINTIFEKFIQSANAVIGTTKGTGLGLTISKNIIELHHGQIWAENHPQGGAIFSFIIPTIN